jgi:hypothetical protein
MNNDEQTNIIRIRQDKNNVQRSDLYYSERQGEGIPRDQNGYSRK